MARPRYIHGKVIEWSDLLAFLDGIHAWNTMMDVSSRATNEVDESFRRIAAAAAGSCTTNHRFPDNLLTVLDMIAHRRAKPFRWHGQISPERWKEANSYAGALSVWLNDLSPAEAAATYNLDSPVLDLIFSHLGEERTKLKTAMVRRYLCHVVYHLSNTTSLAIIGEETHVPKHEVRYLDFSRVWRWNGVQCERLQPTDKPVRDLDDIILASGVAGTNFLDYIKMESSPICHQRILRHMEVALYRIGKEWTEPQALPAGSGGAAELGRLRNDYMDALSRWYDDRGGPDEPGAMKIFEDIARILGKPDARKRALLDCLSFRSSSAEDLQEAAFTWLTTQGCTPLQALKGCE